MNQLVADDSPPSSDEPTLVVIGNFDGVHRGHRAVLSQALARAEAQNLRPVVLTFAPHPAEVLGKTAPPVLTRAARKTSLLMALSPSLKVFVQRFDRSFASLTPAAFARSLLTEQLRARTVVVGENFRFGHARAGDFTMLRELGSELGFAVTPEPVIGDERGPWSSSRIRQSLATGDLEGATTILGRPHALEGVVIAGQARARTLGFPTANIGGVIEALPPYGVYAIDAERLSEEGGVGVPLARGVANIGVRPTVHGGLAIEAHLFDFAADLYGARLRINLRALLRRERQFASLEELREQIARDAEAARAAIPP